jgi:hypothetical protein
LEVLILISTPMPRPKKADIYAHGGKKKQYQFMLTEEASGLLDAVADELGISRSELFERMIRGGGMDAARSYEADGDRS